MKLPLIRNCLEAYQFQFLSDFQLNFIENSSNLTSNLEILKYPLRCLCIFVIFKEQSLILLRELVCHGQKIAKHQLHCYLLRSWPSILEALGKSLEVSFQAQFL